ncbi:hypothetical protein LSTR_LSTR011360 [Laodelphax striatellus]|uniref:Uncharacterized protein n=1 Tax=Laodelphax striatellus TaxID=195883 RepID=A0A482WVT8_LAOST|nr:hypothetical protein LSTR_LSTR011360 [Laodelphax striatellus]
MSVPYDCLELLPPPQPCCTTTAAGGKQLRQLQAKLALQAASAAASAAQPDSTTAPQQQPPPPKKKTSDHRRLKSCQPNEAEAAPPAPDKRRNANSCGGDSANYDQHSMQSSNYLASASSDCYEHELDYQQDIPGSYQHVHMYPTQSCEVTSSSVNYPQHCEGGDHVMSPYAAASPSPTAVYQMSAPPGGSPAAPASTAAAAYCAALNLVPTRSVHADGSDLPMADLPTLRYYYNIGLDYMRMNTCLVAQAQQAQSAAGRPAVGGQLPPHWPAGQYHAYVPADSPVPVPLSYVSHCYEPQPAVSAYAEAGPAAAVPYPSPASVDYNSAVSADSAPPPPDSTSRVTASPNQPAVAPRFKNKRKNEQQTASAATSPSQVSNNKHQPSYSVASANTPIPATVNAPAAATATVSLPPSHFVPVYYHYPSTPATECDRNYCPGYYDSPHWMPYEVPGAAALYPAAAGAATLYSAPQQASYLAADGVYYMQPATIEY